MNINEAILDLHDIQGNIVYGYGRWGYPLSRYLFFKIKDKQQGMEFVKGLVPLVTSSAPLDKQNDGIPPLATTNLAFTYAGLRELGLPDESMRSFPEDFRMGMKARKDILGDDGPSDPENWDPIWQNNYDVHMFLSINATSEGDLIQRFDQVLALVNRTENGVELLDGHRDGDGKTLSKYQSGNAIVIDGKPTANEHFHYVDGITNPVFKGQGRNQADTVGAGKPTRASANTEDGWQPLETGEFVLGHKDESAEYPKAPIPRLLSYNGSFMVYRKLHQNVGKFTSYLKEKSEHFGDDKLSDDEKQETLKAKFAGRWSNGAPLASYPDYASAIKFGEQWQSATDTLFYQSDATSEQKKQARLIYQDLKSKRSGFNYANDTQGARCPLGAHTRRTNPRGSLEFDTDGAFDTPGAMVNRRRILRRGLPYGDSTDRTDNEREHGTIFMVINASIERQFEFVQQQWINYGNDFKLSNEKDVLLGNHDITQDGAPNGRTLINANKSLGQPTFMCSGIPRFVETRGGDYFFIPSLTALRMIAEGIIDPT
ncbi:peroxidase [Paraglaciecola sp. 20A4]|uniref:Dyp-type peroxidase n=1 Tax=Paraglaciecola sp. 20A4 TaxID=2687288 RepID=UPI0014094FF2|nr:peroxidase [Paraglaciecola sp. 20A4]